MKFLRIIAIKGFLFVLLLSITAFNVFAESGELTVIQITRITHPAYDIDPKWKGSRRPINQNNTKILLNERIEGGGVANWTHPMYPGYTGRGVVVGNINALKTCYLSYGDGSDSEWLTCYLAATKPLNNSFISRPCTNVYVGREVGCINRLSSQEVQWSQIPGEENIVYGLYDKNNGMAIQELVRINVDTGATTKVGNYPAGMVSPALWGWEKSNEVIIDADDNDGGPGYLMNVITGATTYYKGPPMRGSITNASSWMYGSMHNDYSPDGKNLAKYGMPEYQGVSNNDCSDIIIPCNTPYYGAQSDWYDSFFEGNYGYVTWTASNDWYIAGTNGVPYSPNSSSPYISTFKVEQVYFNRTNGVTGHKTLLTTDSANTWMYNSKAQNYYSMMSPSLNEAGTMIVYPSTGGKYSIVDKVRCDLGLGAAICSSIATNWGTLGIFLAELAPASGSQTCNSFTYSDWGACQSNNTQTRTVTSSSPSGCTGGTPVLTQSCTYPDTNSDGKVNIKDIQICIKAITAPNSIPPEQLQKCQALAPPDTVANIKDIQVIIQEIIG